MPYCCCGMSKLYNKLAEKFGSGPNSKNGRKTPRHSPPPSPGVAAVTKKKPEVAVAPQPHSHSTKSRHYRDADRFDNSRISASHSSVVDRVDRRGSLVTYHNERLVDGPPSPQAHVSSLEQRVRELESMVAGAHPSTSVIPLTPSFSSKHHHHSSSRGVSAAMPAPTQLIIQSPASNTTNAMTQQIMVKNIVEKEVEIEHLQSQLRKLHNQMEQRQREYDDKVRRFRTDSEASKEELGRVINKLNALDEEYVKYRERAAKMPDTTSEAYRELQHKLSQQESDLRRFQRELEDKRKLEERFEEVQRELEYVDLQNRSLNKELDAKESAVKKLEQNIASMRLEAAMYQQSCSSGSTPLAEDTESLADVRSMYAPARPYTKAHSTLGASSNLSPLPQPKSNLRKSLSNYAIDAARKDDVSASMSHSLRSQQKKLVDSRILTKCLKETLEMLYRGQAPDMTRMLGIKADSMSESEAEPTLENHTALTMGAAEKLMRRQEDSLKKLEQDLEQMRYLVVELYNSRGDTGEECRVQ